MIKKIAIVIVNFYQVVLSVVLKNLLGINKFCRFEETCSAYAKRSIKEHGLVKGSYMGALRLLKCQPFYAIN